MKIVCEKCKTSYLIPEQYAGKKVRCRQCGNIFRAPEDFGFWRDTLTRAVSEFGSPTGKPNDDSGVAATAGAESQEPIRET